MLSFLDFDCSEDADGVCTFDALASVALAQWPRLEAEVVAVLQWVADQAGAGPGPLDEGYLWDHALTAHREQSQVQAIHLDLPGQRLLLEPVGEETVRISLSLVVSCSTSLAVALRDHFQIG